MGRFTHRTYMKIDSSRFKLIIGFFALAGCSSSNISFQRLPVQQEGVRSPGNQSTDDAYGNPGSKGDSETLPSEQDDRDRDQGQDGDRDPGGTPGDPSSIQLPIRIEAESGKIESSIQIGQNSMASGGSFIQTILEAQGKVTYEFEVPRGGNYWIWGRVHAPDSNADSFLVAVDLEASQIYDTGECIWSQFSAQKQWIWTRVSQRTGNWKSDQSCLELKERVFSLSAGRHTLVIMGRENRSQLDAILITDDPAYVP
jgi:hypothetical protein